MGCKRIRDLLSEYIDGELDSRLSAEIKQHLLSCDGCRQIHEAILESSVNPLMGSEKLKAPKHLWGQIRDSIEETEIKRALLPLFAHKPAFSLVTAAVIILIAIVAIKLPGKEANTVASYMEDQLEFFKYLADENGAGQDADMIDIGTDIEKYLL